VKAPRFLTRFLAVVLLGIWGAVGYQVYMAAFARDTDSREANLLAAPKRSEPYVYKADVDDPFQTTAPKAESPKKAPVSIPWTPPPVKVTGILSGNGGMTAILESATGDISFLCEGDTTCGVKILKIRDGLVVYFYHKEKKEWTIDGRQ
jgi:hypothetical protein